MDKKETILLIDDEVDLLDVIQYQFEAKGYQVATARDGVEGLEQLETVKPNLIILDMNMPRMGGIEFYQKICDADKRPFYPVLVLTARANMEQLFRELDIDGFMAKPFDNEQLLREAEIIIKKRSRLGIAREERLTFGPKTVFIVENDGDAFNKISVTFLDAEYKINTAKSGTSAIEKIMADPPDLALVNLSLVDIPGDIVVQRLKRMPKTMDVKCVLYTQKTPQHQQSIIEKFGEKPGVITCVEYSKPEELVGIVNEVFRKRQKK